MYGRYILHEHTPILCTDLDEWARWLQHADRHVAVDTVGEATISTVFLGLDMNFRALFDPDAEPILFETMIFGGPHNGSQWRYATWDAAEEKHLCIVEQLMREELAKVR